MKQERTVKLIDKETGAYLGDIEVEIVITDNTYPNMKEDGWTHKEIEESKKERWRKIYVYSQVINGKKINKGELGFDWL